MVGGLVAILDSLFSIDRVIEVLAPDIYGGQCPHPTHGLGIKVFD